jgi:murein DD-endopeptidase MepM/ murein hydrolase activator NlpD
MVRRVAIFVSVVALTACGTEPPPPAPAVSAVDIRLTADTTLVRGIVPRNATMAAMLQEAGLATEAVDRLIAAARTVFDPRRFRALQPFALEHTLEGALRYFEYEIDRDSFLRVAPTAAAAAPLRAEVLPIPKTLEHAAVAGRIDNAAPSLFQSMDAAGESGDLAAALAEVFSGEIDFNTELQPGDGYAVAFERFHREGRPPSYGVITAAQFENDGRVLHAIRFTPPGGRADYFDEQGRSLRRFFLRSPLKFEPRVTSGFSLRRMHPVLHTARAHRGVDYAAASGSAVVAVAAGSVVSATYDNANGRMVRLRHPSGYESYYLHLSAIAPGIRRGAPVAQGQTIGRVGATGLATGPHLHYGLRKNGAFVNPLREQRNLPPGEPVPAAAMEAFEAERDRALAQLGATMGSAGAPADALAP